MPQLRQQNYATPHGSWEPEPVASIQDHMVLLVTGNRGGHFPKYPKGQPRRVCRVCKQAKAPTAFACCGKPTELTVVYNGEIKYA